MSKPVLDLFSAAAGGWSLGMHRAGYRTVAACEVIDWRRTLYLENNPGVPVYDDVTTLTADRLVRDGVERPYIVVGSPPCQDISSANTKGKGVDGERSSLYFEAVRLIDECRPRWYALENSANLRTRGADRVIAALEAIDYTCWPFVVSAGDVGANHPRKRSWLIGFDARNTDGFGWNAGWEGRGSGVDISDAHDFDGEGGWLPVDRNADSIIESEVVGIHGWPITDDERGAEPTSNADGERWEIRRVDGGVLSPANTSPELSFGRGAAQLGNPPNADQAGQADGLVVTSLRQAPQSDDGCSDVRRDDVPDTDEEGQPNSAIDGEMGGSPGLGGALAEPWADWNSGLAHHLRVDDGLSGWVAQSRIAIGGPKGTVAASLIVEAFGEADGPQIPEAIGRAIARVDAALAAIHGSNDNIPTSEAA